jgi:hypothetical protein
MWATVGKFLFGTAMGRGVLLGGSIAIGFGIGWYAFSSHYYDNGLADGRAECMKDANDANVITGKTNIANNQTSSTIGKEADERAAEIIEDAEEAKQNSKESVNDVYDKPPVTAPVSFDSCVHPLDDLVQDRIRDARAAASGARGS